MIQDKTEHNKHVISEICEINSGVVSEKVPGRIPKETFGNSLGIIFKKIVEK